MRSLKWHCVMGFRRSLPSSALVGGGNDGVGVDTLACQDLDRIRNGVMKPVTTPEFVVDAGAVAVIDGHDGVGHVLTELARKEAVRRARLL